MKPEQILKQAIEKALENYVITYEGDVINAKGNKLRPSTDKSGYKYISVYIGNYKTKKVKVHRLVALTWIENPDNLPQVNHKNGDRSDNRVSNLEWCTVAHNVRDGFDRGRIVWNKGNASKERIYGYCKKYPRQIFWILTNNDFQFAKAFWGEERVSSCCGAKVYTPKGRMMEYCKKCKGMLVEETYPEIAWVLHLQQMVLEKEPLKYLAKHI